MSMDRSRLTREYMPLRMALDRLFEGSVITPQVFDAESNAFPPADLHITDDDVIVHIAVPGANPDDINISVTGERVDVRGEIRHPQTSGTEQQGTGQRESQASGSRTGQSRPLFREIWQGTFERSFTLPIRVDAGKASASYEHGILTLTLPKSEATKPRRIQVQAGGQRGSSSDQSGSTETEVIPVQNAP
jgi:HSP20 family protein